MAGALRRWFPEIIQRIDPWMSSEDVDKGERWSTEILALLEQTDQGIICVTSENAGEPWLNFEAGALSKSLTRSRVRPVLLDLTPSDLRGPLQQFQATAVSDPEDMLRLLKSLNKACDVPIEDRLVERAFGHAWPDLDQAISAVLAQSATDASEEQRTTERKIDEILQYLRAFSDPPNFDLRHRNLIIVDLGWIDPSLGWVAGKVFPDTTVSQFLDDLYRYVEDYIEAYTYGETWALRSSEYGLFRDLGSRWARMAARKSDDRRLREVGLMPGMELQAVRLRFEFLPIHGNAAALRLGPNRRCGTHDLGSSGGQFTGPAFDQVQP